jgi:uncharacterized protein (TIGR02118 family)
MDVPYAFMVKLVFCLTRREGMSREAFQTYWRETHAPLVRSHAELLGIRRYVQVHTMTNPVNNALQVSRHGPDAYDGVAEIWWDSVVAMAAAATTDAGSAASWELLEDERRFIDLERSPLFFGEENSVLG